MKDLSIYELFKDKMCSGDHVSWDGDTLIGNLIKVFTTRNHSSMVFRPVEFAALADRRWIVEADEGEVNVRLLSRKLEEYKGKAYWHKLKPEYDGYRARMTEFLSSQVGTHYDYGSLLANIFGHTKANRDRLICSELSTMCYMESIPRTVLSRLLPDAGVSRMLLGETLRPGEVAALPLFDLEVRIL